MKDTFITGLVGHGGVSIVHTLKDMQEAALKPAGKAACDVIMVDVQHDFCLDRLLSKAPAHIPLIALDNFVEKNKDVLWPTHCMNNLIMLIRDRVTYKPKKHIRKKRRKSR